MHTRKPFPYFLCSAVRVVLLFLLGFAFTFGGQNLAGVYASTGPLPPPQPGDQADIQSSLLGGGGRTLNFPANALNYSKTSTILTQDAAGIRWQASYLNPAYLDIPRPSDWDGTTSVVLRLLFYTTTTPAASSQVSFFIRPRAFNPGDIFTDASSIDATPVPVTALRQICEQDFIIPASSFGTKAQWVITIQRGGIGETYTDDVILTSVGLSYLPAPAPNALLVLPANALNYDRASTILTQDAAGIRWQADYRNPAYLNIPRPSDWDGTSDVTLRLFFYPTTTPGAGSQVSFFVRPRAFNSGDIFIDASAINSTPVPVTVSQEVREQDFLIPASRFGTKAQWVITIQRGGTGETYSGDVMLTSAGLSYGARAASSATLTLPANALNYDKASTILTQDSTGIRWQADYRNPAYLNIPRPSNWDGTSVVVVRLFFYPTTTPSAGSQVSFFVRPRAFNSGDIFIDASSLDGVPVPVTAWQQVREQDFFIPASRFGSKSQWVITIQRGGTGETYSGDVILTSVGLSYLDKKIYLPIIER